MSARLTRTYVIQCQYLSAGVKVQARKIGKLSDGWIEIVSAHFDAPQRDVHIRVAGHDGKLYLDLADDAWRAVEIDEAGWRIVDEPPVRFRRAAGMQPLPRGRWCGRSTCQTEVGARFTSSTLGTEEIA